MNVAVSGIDATATATRGSGYYQYRLDNETVWTRTGERTGLADGSHVFYSRDLLFPSCQLNNVFNIGTVSANWLAPVIQTITATSTSASITVRNPNIGGRLRIDYSLTNADVNDATGNYWKWGGEQDGASTANQSQTIIINGLTPSTTYYFRGFYYGAGKGNSPWQYLGGQPTQSSGQQLGTPILTASLSYRDVTLTWTDNSVGNAGYEIQYSLNSGSTWTSLNNYLGPTVRSYVHTNVPTGVTINYRVAAFASSNGNWSNTASVTVPTGRLASPLLSVSVSGSNAILTWTDTQSDVYRYRIERSIEGAAFTLLTSREYDERLYSTAIDQNVNYAYRIQATSITPSLNSGYSNTVTVYVPGTPGGGVPTPTISGNLTGSSGSYGAFVSWNNNGAASVTGYTLDYKVGTGGTWTNIYTNQPGEGSYSTGTLPSQTDLVYYRVKTVTSSGSSSYSSELILNPVTSEGDVYAYETRSSYLSGSYHPVQKFGKYTRPIRNFGPGFDFIGGQTLIYNYVDNTYSMTNLGMQFSGIYTATGETSPTGFNNWKTREPKERRYIYYSQRAYESVNSPLPQEFFPMVSPTGVGYTFTMDNGQSVTVDNDLRGYHWVIPWAWKNRNETGVQTNGDFTWVRLNAEGHNHIFDSYDYYVKIRYMAENGTKYSPARAGGSDNTTADGDPAYASMSDADFYLWCIKTQAQFNNMIALRWASLVPGSKVFLYGEGRPGFPLTDGGVRGWRQDATHTWPTDQGITNRDALVAGTQGFLDVMLELAPFSMRRTDNPIDPPGDAPAFYQFADLSILENNQIHNTAAPVAGTAEWFSYKVVSDGGCPSGDRVIIRFGDKDGNRQVTGFPIRIRNDYNQANQEVNIPAGVDSASYCQGGSFPLPSRFKNGIDDQIDGTLIENWFQYWLNLAANNKPIAHQIYPWLKGLEQSNAANETIMAGQLPKRFVNAFTFLGQFYQSVDVWYQIVPFDGATQWVCVLQGLDNLFAANKRLSAYNSHFNGNEVTCQVEVSMDGGSTWTETGSIYQPTGSADFTSFKSTAYGPRWVDARKASSMASPLILASYNAAQGSYVIAERALYGTSVNYSFRIRKPDGSTKTFLSRSATRDIGITQVFD